MPDLSTTGTEVAVIRWLVQLGEEVRRGQPLLELETDKAVGELESIASGTVKSLEVKPGDFVDTGTIVAVLEVAEPIGTRSTEHSPQPTPVGDTDLPVGGPPHETTSAAPSPKSNRGSMFSRNRTRRNE